MTDFKIQAQALKANPLFLDIHKHKLDQVVHHAVPESTPFTKFKKYEEHIGLMFKDLPEQHRFWLHDGKELASLKQLYQALDTMTDDSYALHANERENHFAEWVKHVYHDDWLYERLVTARTRMEARKAIEERIDNLTEVSHAHDEKSFLKQLVLKLNTQNKKLEEELLQKKEWLKKKQESLEAWDKKNHENESALTNKYHELMRREETLKHRLHEIEDDEASLKHAIESEEAKLEEQNKAIKEEKGAIIKLREQVSLEKQKIAAQSRQIAHEWNAIEKEKHSIDKEKSVVRETREQNLKSLLDKKHEPFYQRLDELMSYAVACISEGNYREARDALAKVRYYYQNLPESEPRKAEYYHKIMDIKSQLHSTMQKM